MRKYIGLLVSLFAVFFLVAMVVATRFEVVSNLLRTGRLEKPQASQTYTVTNQISQSTDDAEEFLSNRSVNLTGQGLGIGTEEGNAQLIGLRFTNINIPKNSTITNAYIEFTSLSTNSYAVSTRIFGIAEDNPGTFTSSTGNISAKPQTNFSVSWDIPKWEANSTYQSPNVAAIIQEIVNRASWAPGNAMGFIVRESQNIRSAISYDKNPSQAPRLVIEYYEKESSQPLADAPPPSQPVKLIFHGASTFHDWMGANRTRDRVGNLLSTLNQNNYYVSDFDLSTVSFDTNQEVGRPFGYLASYNDIGYFYTIFRGVKAQSAYLPSLYNTQGLKDSDGLNQIQQASGITRPSGENTIILLKNHHWSTWFHGNISDAPTPINSNSMRGRTRDSETADYPEVFNIANAKSLYLDLLNYFKDRQDKLFVIITNPPINANATVTSRTSDALRNHRELVLKNNRDFNSWLVNDWLDNYPYNNVVVFDIFNILTHIDNHHRINSQTGQVEYITANTSWNYLAPEYTTGPTDTDSHPATAGYLKATAEFVPYLNEMYRRWKTNEPPPPQVNPTPSCTITLPNTVALEEGSSTSLTATVTAQNGTVSEVRFLSSNTSVVRVTSPDNSSPYSSILSGIGAGTASVTASVIIDGTTRCSSTVPVNVNATAALVAPDVYSPISTVSVQNPAFQWGTVSAAAAYNVYVNTSTGQNVVNRTVQSNVCSGSTCTANLNLSLPQGSYRWWVRGISSQGMVGPWSSRADFVISLPVPPAVVITNPTPGTITSVSSNVSPNAFVYKWNVVSDATNYEIYLGTSSRVQKLGTTVTSSSACGGASTCSYTYSGHTLANDSYRLWVRAQNPNGWGPWSQRRDFTLNAPVPIAATLSSPRGNIYSTRPTFVWTDVPNATWYRFYLSSAAGVLVTNQWIEDNAGVCNGTTCSFTPNVTLTRGTSYRWWIRPWGPGGAAPWSTRTDFTVR